MAILLISSEIEELVGLSHRVVVMARGRTIAELEDEDVQEERVLHAAFDSESQRRLGGERHERRRGRRATCLGAEAAAP